MSRWLAAVLIVPLLVVSVLAVTIVRAQNAIHSEVTAATGVASLATLVNTVDEALGAEALAGRRVIDDPSLWDDFITNQAVETDHALDALSEFMVREDDVPLERAIGRTTNMLLFREDMASGVVSPLQLAHRYSVPRTELLNLLRESDQAATLERLIALIEARSAHLDERFSTELALSYGTWAPGQYNNATGALAIQTDRIRAANNGGTLESELMIGPLSQIRDQVQLSSDIPEILSADFASASDLWLKVLNDEIDREAAQIALVLDDQAANAASIRWWTIAGVVVGVGLAFLTAGLISFRIVGRVGLIADFAKRFAIDNANPTQLSQVVKGRDELADLAIVLDEMAGEVRKRDQRLAALAQIDDLTQILNRKAVIEAWRSYVGRPGVDAFAFAIDLDGFKPINDRFGHHAGDMALIEVAKRLTDGVSKHSAVVGRTGGDEFLVVLEAPADGGLDPKAFGERLVHFVRSPIDIDGRFVSVDATIGVVQFRRDGSTPTRQLRDADDALYVAKSQGGGIVLVSDAALRDELAAFEERRVSVGEALGNNEFQPWYQPIWDRHNNLIGFEALARWVSEDGIRGTADFIDVMENQQLVHVLDANILRLACETLEEWSRRSHAQPIISVNISTGFLEQYGFVSVVQELLKDYDIEPSSLVLEVTESGLMTDPAASAERLQLIRQLGVRVSVDDYGTGYSSLSYIRQLPIDILKLDRQFVEDVDSKPKNQAIARSVLALTADLGIRSVVEGVERAEELAWLLDNGADLLQGYFLGRPIHVDEAWELFKSQSQETEERAA